MIDRRGLLAGGATMLATARPGGPVYVNLDVTLQEMALDSVPALHDVSRFRPPGGPSTPRTRLVGSGTARPRA